MLFILIVIISKVGWLKELNRKTNAFFQLLSTDYNNYSAIVEFRLNGPGQDTFQEAKGLSNGEQVIRIICIMHYHFWFDYSLNENTK